MPLTHKGEEILHNMEKEHGKEGGEREFYASKNAGTISGVDCSLGASKMEDVSTSPYYGDPVIDPTQTSSGTMMMPDANIETQPSGSVPEQPSVMREPIDSRDASPSSADTFAALGAMADQSDAWSRMTGNRDFSGDENSRLGKLPAEVSHKDMQRMAEGFNYSQGYASNPYGRK